MMTAATELLADLTRLGVQVVAHGDHLRYRPQSLVTPELAARLKTHKPELLAILRPAVAPDVATTTTAPSEAIAWEECIDPPVPCPECGGLVFWRAPWHDRRCAACDPPATAIKALERTEGIRRRHRIPRPAGAAELLAGLKRLTCTG